jgi:hypothetical protein
MVVEKYLNLRYIYALSWTVNVTSHYKSLMWAQKTC